jgi:predicted amidohydrolase
MEQIVVAGCQFSVKPMDIESNITKSLVFLERAVIEHGADLVVFPETITTGFLPFQDIEPGEALEKLWETVDVIPGKCTERIQEAASQLGVHVIWTTYSRGEREGVIHNSAVVIADDGTIKGNVYHKTHPFPEERFEGGGWTTAGMKPEVVDTRLAKIGLTICYDGDFPELARVEALQGAEIICRPSAFLRSFDVWEFTNKARAYDNHVYYVAVNAVGSGPVGYFGNSMIIDPTGWKLAQARGCDEIVSATLNPDPIKFMSCGTKSPMTFDHLEDRNVQTYEGILKEGKSNFEPARRIRYRR